MRTHFLFSFSRYTSDVPCEIKLTGRLVSAFGSPTLPATLVNPPVLHLSSMGGINSLRIATWLWKDRAAPVQIGMNEMIIRSRICIHSLYRWCDASRMVPVPVWLSAVFVLVGVLVIVFFTFKHGVFDTCFSSTSHVRDVRSGSFVERVGIGVGESDESEFGVLRGSQVSAFRIESAEEGSSGDDETESGRSGGFSSDDGSEEAEA